MNRRECSVDETSQQARKERRKLVKVLRRHGKDNVSALDLADILENCSKKHRCVERHRNEECTETSDTVQDEVSREQEGQTTVANLFATMDRRLHWPMD